MNIEMLDFPKTQFSVITLQKIHDDCKKECAAYEYELIKTYKDECNAYEIKCKKAYEDDDVVIKQTIKEPPKLSTKVLNALYQKLVDYVQLYYYETSGGNYWFYDVIDKVFKLVLKKTFQDEVMTKIEKSLYVKLFEKNNKIFRIVSRLNKPRVFKENGYYYINECAQYLHTKYKKYSKYSTEIKEKVQKVLDMIKLITCDSNEELFKAYEKYLSQLVKGIKTEVVIYKKSDQGTGKSTETDFLINYVLGKDLCVISGTEPLLSNFNKILLGKLLVVFEELPTFSQREWEVVSSKIKTMTTEKTFVYRSLFKDAIEAENISNFMINTNCDSIKDSDGRRILIMPVSNCKRGDTNYFTDIRKSCFNLEVGEAFFSYLMEINTDKFYAQSDFPITENKKLAISNLLHPVYKFLKFQYILKKVGLEKIKPKELYEEYVNWCSTKDINHQGTKRTLQKNDFMKKLEEIGFKYSIVHGINYYKKTYEELLEIATKGKWLCDYDEVEEEDDETDVEHPLDVGYVDYKEKCKQLEKHIKELENKLKSLNN